MSDQSDQKTDAINPAKPQESAIDVLAGTLRQMTKMLQDEMGAGIPQPATPVEMLSRYIEHHKNISKAAHAAVSSTTHAPENDAAGSTTTQRPTMSQAELNKRMDLIESELSSIHEWFVSKKKEAGYDPRERFSTVWEEVLAAAKRGASSLDASKAMANIAHHFPEFAEGDALINSEEICRRLHEHRTLYARWCIDEISHGSYISTGAKTEDDDESQRNWAIREIIAERLSMVSQDRPLNPQVRILLSGTHPHLTGALGRRNLLP